MNFAVGSLVSARDREWVVLPESRNDLLILRPLGGSEHETAGIYLPLEPVKPATFSLPDPAFPGDYYSCNLLRNAVRLGFRSSAGPFRSFGKIAVDPRPYQLVPLLMALRLDPIRILIADDVGIGKTIEAGLIARELLDRGEIQRLAILCPPPLAEQWQAELAEKFHIQAELVLSGTATRLERACRVGESLFDRFPFVIVSTDFIKSDRRQHEFLRTCPEMVIVDEAHTCAYAGEGKGIRHQRHRLISGLIKDENRHLILVTATPHSGKEEAFRSLLTLLKSEFAELPEDLSGKRNEAHRRHLAAHFVQRKRGDIKSYMDSETVFPNRTDSEASYKLSPEYKKVFDRALMYARESVTDKEGGKVRQRVRWWSALALLRSLASSPAAAVSTLRNRAAAADAETVEAADELGRKTVLDLHVDEASESIDVTPGCDTGDEESKSRHQKLMKLARDAEDLKGKKDKKLEQGIKIVKNLLKEGFQPIVFCRFVPTAEYVAENLRKKLPKTEVMAVTGLLPPKEREDRISELSESPKRVLVCTDCLSEGINLQEHFDAVFHYDLAWNPTRHEQREGRVDRYGQPGGDVRVVTYYGTDNQIDGIVLNVLIRKHKKIRSSLGISVPVPADTNQVVEAILEGLLLREKPAEDQQYSLPGFEAFVKEERENLYKNWDSAANKEKRSRTMFAQRTIRVDEIWQELKAVQEATGAGENVEQFVRESLAAYGAAVSGDGLMTADLGDPTVPHACKEAAGHKDHFKARFTLPVRPGEMYLNRTHPVVEGLAGYVMECAFDNTLKPVAKRCGVIRTRLVERRTTLLLVRFRYHIITKTGHGETPLLAEDCQVFGFAGSSAKAEWIDSDRVEKLIQAKPEENVSTDQAIHFLKKLIDNFDHLRHPLEELAKENGRKLLKAHTRVRKASQKKGIRYRVEPNLPPDVLGAYIYLPLK